jgi:hypothetical protein
MYVIVQRLGSESPKSVMSPFWKANKKTAAESAQANSKPLYWQHRMRRDMVELVESP